MTAETGSNTLIPEWSVDEDDQIAAAGVIVGLVMLFVVFGLAGLSLFGVFDVFDSADSAADGGSTEVASVSESRTAVEPDLGPAELFAADEALDVELSVEGNEATIEGLVPTVADGARLVEIAGGVEGVDTVRNAVRVLEPDVVAAVDASSVSAGQSASGVSARMDQYTAVIEGVVSDADTHQSIVSAVSSVEGVDGVDDRLIVLDGPVNAVAADSGLRVAADLTGRDVTLTGVVPTRNDAKRLFAEVTAVDGVESVTDQLRVLEDDVVAANTTPSVVAGVDGYDAVLTGTVADQADASDLVSAMAAVDGVESVDDQMVVAAEEWSLLGFDRASVSLDGTTVVLAGVVPTATDRTAAVDMGSKLPGIADVDDRLTVLGDEIDAALELTSLDDVAVKLEGRDATITGTVVSDARAAEIVDIVAALEGIGSVTNELEVAPSELEVDLNGLVALDPIRFASGSDEIIAESLPVLDRAVELLTDSPDGRITIEGHTDDSGDADANQLLSLERAQAVADHLAEQGIAADRMIVVGFGEEMPAESNATPEGRAANRRIEFRIG